jgi:hypothetical protein
MQGGWRAEFHSPVEFYKEKWGAWLEANCGIRSAASPLTGKVLTWLVQKSAVEDQFDSLNTPPSLVVEVVSNWNYDSAGRATTAEKLATSFQHGLKVAWIVHTGVANVWL